MPVRLARITYERPLHVWRLRLDPDATGAGDKVGDLIGSSGIIHDPDDELKVTMHLAGWGVRPEPGGWRDADGTWGVPAVDSSSARAQRPHPGGRPTSRESAGR